MGKYKVGDHVVMKLSGGRLVQATIKAIIDTTAASWRSTRSDCFLGCVGAAVVADVSDRAGAEATDVSDRTNTDVVRQSSHFFIDQLFTANRACMRRATRSMSQR
jgi:hypothetical protein